MTRSTCTVCGWSGEGWVGGCPACAERATPPGAARIAALEQAHAEALALLDPGRLFDLRTGVEVPTTLVERARWVAIALAEETRARDEAQDQRDAAIAEQLRLERERDEARARHANDMEAGGADLYRRLQQAERERDEALAFHKVAVKERDYERVRADRLERERDEAVANLTVNEVAVDTARAARDEARGALHEAQALALRLGIERDEARHDLAHSRACEELTHDRCERLVALLRAWRDLDPLGAPPSESLLDRTDAVLEEGA